MGLALIPNVLKDAAKWLLRRPWLAPFFGWLIARRLTPLNPEAPSGALRVLVFSDFRWRQDLAALITETHYFLTESRCCRGRLNHALNTTVRQPLKKPLYSLRLYTQQQLCSCPSLDELLSGFDGIFRVANFGHEICTDKR